MGELLPCPFCGGEAKFVPYKNNGLTLRCGTLGCIRRDQRTLRYGLDWLEAGMTKDWNTRAAQPAVPVPQWQDIATALKNGVPVLLKFKAALPSRVENFAGIVFVGCNRGNLSEWQFAAPVGMGGIPDEWLEGWQPAPPAASPTPKEPTT